ncbi:hypothetical protein [Blastococcus tunisiensis]|uniref:Uncharacterized protein n=1 Tax=Blastococcus tunisiensis TaxID=1798228 RepID=A0A1I2ILZ0_9ACTN|nr:hypothetical protein [Blastococcus sp. DSM 46838]SFF42700.1 hypothetical protein SAMN05216574_113111 [Blastococcus sp. DSM 46838]
MPRCPHRPEQPVLRWWFAGHEPVALTVRIALHPAADDLPGHDPLALLIEMLLDQHIHGRSGESVAFAGARIR